MKRNFLKGGLILMTAAAPFTCRVTAASYGDDIAFLKKHTDLIELSDEKGFAKVAVAPAWQGRVLTSTAGNDAGLSFGWINRELIAAGKVQPHINVFGGEDRFWMGPEGGQFSVFFAKGAMFELADWFTPAAFDTEPFKLISRSRNRAVFATEFTLTNFSGTRFEVAVNREVRLLDTAVAWKKLGVPSFRDVSLVAYETDNKITNTGKAAWKKETGLISVWILGMFTPTPSTTIVVPIKPGAESDLGTKVTSDYFGNIPPDRLVVKDDVICLRGDGKFRGKIGVNPRRSKAVLGSYDADNKVLTIVQFSQPAGVVDYVNSLWKFQDNPYSGDAANSYNDGPPAPGAKPLGPFYELESSSPAAALGPKESLSHIHRTIHVSGSESDLNVVAHSVFGVSIADIKAAFTNQ